MHAGFAMLPLDVKSPVRASKISGNWMSLPFFKQTTYRNQSRSSFGRK